jgi:LPXTG-motif cell wall-anchored protein
MSNFDDNLFENFDAFEGFDEEQPSGKAPKPKQNNRNFWVAIGVIGVFVLLIVAAMVVYMLMILPQQREAQMEQAAQISAQNTMTVQAATQMALAQAQFLMPSPTNMVVLTKVPTNTPVVVFPTATEEATMAAAQLNAQGGDLFYRTQTVAALLTLAAGGSVSTQTAQGQTVTALPTTGFAEDVGLPGLFGLGILLLAVVFVVRRLRNAASV